jgi:hypothetical protein
MRNIYDSRIIKKTSHDGASNTAVVRQGAVAQSWQRPNVSSRGDSASSADHLTMNTRTNGSVVLPSVKKNDDDNNSNFFLRNHNRSPLKGRNTAPSYTTPDTSFENSYEKEQHSPDDNAVEPIQFSPQSPDITTLRQKPKSSSLNSASWDAVLHHNQNQVDDNDYHFDEKKEAEIVPMVQFNSKQNLSYQSLNYDSRSTVSNGISGIRRAPVGGRIARLATIFTSRATVSSIDAKDGDVLSPSITEPTTGRTTLVRSKSEPDSEFGNNKSAANRDSPVSTMTPMPLSPVASSGSSAYVGWPGTQDRLGQTVAHQSSYDDSSVGAPQVTSLSVVPLTRSNAALRSVNCLRRQHHHHQEEELDVTTNSTRKTRKCIASDPTYEDYGSTDESLTCIQPIASRTSIDKHREMNTPFSTKPTNTRNTQSIIDTENQEAAYNPAEYHLAGAIADAVTRTSVPQIRQSFSSLQYSKGNNETNTHQDAASNPSIPFSWNRKNLEISSSSLDKSSSPQASEATKTDLTMDMNITSNFHDNGLTAKFAKSEVDVGNGASTTVSVSKSNPTENTINPKQLNRFQELRQNADTAALQMFGNTSQILAPTEKAIAENNLVLSPHRTFPNSEGYMGLLDKTKDVPALMDNIDSDTSMSSSKATSLSTNVPNQSSSLSRKLSQNDAIYELEGLNKRPIIRGILRTSTLDRSVISDLDNESDVFDGLSVTKESDIFDNIASTPSPRKHKAGGVRYYPDRIAEEEDDADFNDTVGNNNSKSDVFKIVVLPGGLTTIQTTDRDYSKRQTASDYDDQLTASEVSSNGCTRIPGLEEMILSGVRQDSSLHGIDGNFGRITRQRIVNSTSRSFVQEDITHATGGEDNDDEQSYTYDSEEDTINLRQYRVNPSSMQKLVNKYRKMSDDVDSNMSLDQFEIDEDDNKAFALFEMRSRIMARDIARGLERRGGTKVVDDIVTTSSNRAAHRVRDAIIVCKAWRDGATISDVVKTSILGRKNERTYYIRRRARDTSHRNIHFYSDTASYVSGISAVSSPGTVYWEAVKWLDDTDILQYRCPTLGSRHLRGFEMFTVGDCQSMLLKLTNERCMVGTNTACNSR